MPFQITTTVTCYLLPDDGAQMDVFAASGCGQSASGVARTVWAETGPESRRCCGIDA